MPQPKPRPQVFGILFLSLAGMVGVWRSWSHAWDPAAHDLRSPKHSYQADLLIQESATPGKVIRAKTDGKELAEYTCAPQDAAVALVSLTGASDDSNMRITVRGAKDEQGRKYAVEVHSVGNLYFVTLQKGFPERPTRVFLQAEFSIPSAPSGEYVASLPILFTKIAPPIRILEKPTGDALKTAEAVAVAEYVENPGVLCIKIGHGAVGTSTIIATSFCPIDRPQNPRLNSAKGMALYDDRTDAVKVRIDLSKRIESEAVVTYKDARIIVRDGKQVLWLPSTQEVGSINGYPTIVRAFNDATYRGIRFKHSQGIVYLRLNRQSTGNEPIEVGNLSCIGVSPPVETMGLDWLEVDVDAYEYRILLKQSTKSKGPYPTMIPKLTLRFRIDRYVKDSSPTLVLPVHHVAQDPSVARPIPVG